MKKEEFYKRIKVTGLIFFIPIVLGTGPLAGYFFGEFLSKKFSLGPYAILISIAIGFLGSIIEVIKIVRLVDKTDKG